MLIRLVVLTLVSVHFFFPFVIAQSFENVVVPNARQGEFEHGTYPSLGNRTHPGIDLVAACGSNIYAFADGKVSDVILHSDDVNFNTLGYMVLVEHPATLVGEPFYTIYLHMQEPPPTQTTVHGGKTVLGKVGDTGVAYGCHTHFEIRYFPGRFSTWNNIYGEGDRRQDDHFKQNWEDPVLWFRKYPRGLSQDIVDADKLGDEFLQAVIQGDVDQVKKLLAAGVDVNFKEGSALLNAVTRGYTEVVGLLLEAGTTANAQHLVHTLQRGHLETADLLLDAGVRFERNTVTLNAAAFAGHEGIITELLDSGIGVNGDPETDLETPLMAAARGGHESIVSQLLEQGADVNIVVENWGGDSGGKFTVLSLAAKDGHANIVRMLLDSGADASSLASNTYCRTALGHALAAGNSEIVGMLLAQGASYQFHSTAYAQLTPAMRRNSSLTRKHCIATATFAAAAEGGFTSIVKRMLVDGASANTDAGVGYKGSGTALMGAAKNGHLEIVELLLSHGANPNKRSESGTPLSLAKEGGHSQIATLLEANSNPSPDENKRHRNIILPPLPTKEEENSSDVYMIVGDMPELIGGLASIQSKIIYPASAKNADVEGRVFVQFVVDESGGVINPVVVRGIGAGCDEEAVRVVKLARFKPGKQNGVAVKVKMSLPITFKISDTQ